MSSPGPRAAPVDSLHAATALTPLAPGRFRLQVPEGWRQGRGAFGGVVLGALTRALLCTERDEARPLRSLSGELVQPVEAGPAEVEVEALWLGGGVSTWQARLLQAGETRAHLTGVLGRARAAAGGFSPPPPAPLPAWQQVAPLPLSPPQGPEFCQHFEYRSLGPPPFSGAAEAVAEGWLRQKAPLPVLEAPEVVALADAWWPAALACERAPLPVATVAFTLQLCAPPSPLAPGQPLRHRARAVAAQAGYVVELRELWTAEGVLLALNQQTFAWGR